MCFIRKFSSIINQLAKHIIILLDLAPDSEPIIFILAAKLDRSILKNRAVTVEFLQKLTWIIALRLEQVGEEGRVRFTVLTPHFRVELGPIEMLDILVVIFIITIVREHVPVEVTFNVRLVGPDRAL